MSQGEVVGAVRITPEQASVKPMKEFVGTARSARVNKRGKQSSSNDEEEIPGTLIQDMDSTSQEAIFDILVEEHKRRAHDLTPKSLVGTIKGVMYVLRNNFGLGGTVEELAEFVYPALEEVFAGPQETESDVENEYELYDQPDPEVETPRVAKQIPTRSTKVMRPQPRTSAKKVSAPRPPKKPLNVITLETLREYRDGFVLGSRHHLPLAGEEFELCKALNCPFIGIADCIKGTNLFSAVCTEENIGTENSECPKEQPLSESEQFLHEALVPEVGEETAIRVILRRRAKIDQQADVHSSRETEEEENGYTQE